MLLNARIPRVVAPALIALLGIAAQAAEHGPTAVFDVAEITFEGPMQTARDSPGRDIELSAVFRHESGAPEYVVDGFWDGDGHGGGEGRVFKIRFCPTQPGRWTIVEVRSNRAELAGQRRGDTLVAEPSSLHGFWEVDEESPGRRWYRRSDGSRQYVLGNTHYSFLTECGPQGRPSGGRIAQDVRRNAEYFKKLRFGLTGCRFPHPTEKPFCDDDGRPTDDGDYSHRPNPRWFHERVDLAVRTAHQVDLVADLILCGPDTEDARATLRAGANRGDAGPWLRYIAARYGSYPNVWICLCNEFDIKNPKYTPEQIAGMGRRINEHLPYLTPLSVHTVPNTLWPEAFDALPAWHDHQIIQKKLRDVSPSADVMRQVWRGPSGNAPRRKPTVNDELSYQGDGDKHGEVDTIAAHLGAFLGGGYGSTGYKPAAKLGQYFWGRFDPDEHSAADNLQWLRVVIDGDIPFWRMEPHLAIFENVGKGYRGLAWPGQSYVLGTDEARSSVVAKLPPGRWDVTRYDAIAKQTHIVAQGAEGRFVFDVPEGRAVLFCFRRK